MGLNIKIRQAVEEDILMLTSISFASKRYWKYDESYFRAYENAFAITPHYIHENIVRVAIKDGSRIGYYSLVKKGRVYELEYLFIMPAYIRKGIGTQMMNDMVAYCLAHHIDSINIKCEENVRIFFQTYGAEYMGSTTDIRSHIRFYEFKLITKEKSVPLTLVSQKKKSEYIEDKDKTFNKASIISKISQLDTEEDELDEEEGLLSEIPMRLEDFKFTMPIPYKFECEEEDNSEEEMSKAQDKVQDKVSYNIIELKREGEAYIPWGNKMIKDKERARRLLSEYKNELGHSKRQAVLILRHLFYKVGQAIRIEPNFICTYGYNISIGNHFYAGDYCRLFDSGKITIGDNCILSSGVCIQTVEYPSEAVQRSKGYEYTRPVTLGDNVWIGENSVIMPGVKIGDNVIVKPCSVVSSDIEDGRTVAGNPAKVIMLSKNQLKDNV